MTDELCFHEMMEKMKAYRPLTTEEAQRAIDEHTPIPRSDDADKNKVFDTYEDFIAYLKTIKDELGKGDDHD